MATRVSSIALTFLFLLAAGCSRDEGEAKVSLSPTGNSACLSSTAGKSEQCPEKGSISPASASVVKQQDMKAVLDAFLKNHPEFRLVDAEDVVRHEEWWDGHSTLADVDVPGSWFHEFITTSFHPYEIADTTRDGTKDIVAVLVSNGGYNVVAFHGEDAAKAFPPHWLVQNYQGGIAGIHPGIMPLFCIQCDANPFYVWTGDTYEAGAFNVGEVVCLLDHATLYSKDDEHSPVVLTTDKLIEAAVTEIGQRKKETTGPDDKGYRWYRVKLKKSTDKEGFVKSTSASDGDGLCE